MHFLLRENLISRFGCHHTYGKTYTLVSDVRMQRHNGSICVKASWHIMCNHSGAVMAVGAIAQYLC